MGVLEALGMGGANSGDSGSMTPESLAIRRKLAQAMMSEGMDSSPVSSTWQGIDRVAKALLGSYNLNKTEEADKRGQDEANATLVSAFAPNSAAPVASPAPAAQPLPVMGRPAPGSPAGGAMAAAGRSDDSADIYAPIRQFEGFAPTAKWDYKQNRGGYGSRAQPGQTFTREQAESAMRAEADPIAARVRQLNPNATPSQVAALVSFGYNLGPGVIDRFAPDIQAGNWAAIAQKMPEYNHAGGEVLPGLTSRRQSEAAMLTGGGQPASAAQPVADQRGAMRVQAIKLMANPRTADMGKQMLLKLMGNDIKGAAATGRGTTPHAMTDADGNLVYGTIGEDGSWKPLSGTGGYKPAPKAMTSDTGTEIITRDAYGNELRRTPKDVAGKERDEAIGKSAAQAEAALPAAGTMVENALQTIQQLRDHPGRATGTGLSGTLDPRNYFAGTDATDFRVMSRQAKSQSFMAARDNLKGAGQVTDFEGKKGEEAIAALDEAQSDGQYLRALGALERMMVASYRDLEKKAGMSRGGAARDQMRASQPIAPPAAAPANPVNDPLGILR